MTVVRHHLRCLDCGTETPTSLELSCRECGGLFEVDYPRLPEGDIRLPLAALPLGQGGTPTISFDWPEARRLRLELKLEYLAPTGSFKDRGAAMLIGAAWSAGATAFVEDSSGNAGAALAAYAAAARISAEIFVPANAPQSKAIANHRGRREHPHRRRRPRSSSDCCRAIRERAGHSIPLA